MSSGLFAFVTRRRALALGLGAAGVVVAGGVALNRAPLEDAPASAFLDRRRFRTLTLLARTHLPPGGSYPRSADDAALALKFDGFLRDEPPDNVRDLRLALTLVELGPVLFDARARTFSNLDDAERLAHWQSASTSRLLVRRQSATAFRKFFSLVFFDDEAVWAHIGYPGPSLQVAR